MHEGYHPMPTTVVPVMSWEILHMLSFRFVVTTAAVLLSFTCAAALFATTRVFGEAPARIRGTVTAIADTSITVKARNGRTFTLKTGPYTTYADVVPSTIEEVKVNDFVGSAVKGPPPFWVAVELAIVPEGMRAGRISLYDWDPLPDPTAKNKNAITATSMTNGLVSVVSPTRTEQAETSTTNGIVAREKGDIAGRTLTVTYDGGSKSFQITVPPNAPVVRYELADRSAIALGSVVMIKTNPGQKAALVSIGKGVTPPM
jgi:hypothetical protein